MIEYLEDRIAPALTVYTLHGIFHVTGTPNGDVCITELPGGQVQVTDGNGVFGTLGNVSTLDVHLNPAADHNDVLNLSFGEGFLTTAIIAMGGGNNSVHFVKGTGTSTAFVTGADGDDFTDVGANASLRALYVNTYGGNNTVQVAGHVSGTVNVETFDGDDTVTVPSTGSIQRLLTNLRGGNDTVTITGAVKGLAQIITNNGEDNVQITPSAVIHELAIYTGTGNDIVSVGGHTDGTTYISTSEGDDTVTNLPSATAGNLTVQLAGGNDTMNLSGSLTTAALIQGGGGDDTVLLGNGFSVTLGLKIELGGGTNVMDYVQANSGTLGHADHVTITAGSGSDSVRLSGLQVTHAVHVSLGGGANSFFIPARLFAGNEVAALNAESFTYAGGGGVDAVTIDSSLSSIGTGVFTLKGGNDIASITGSKSIFTSSINVSGGAGNDTFFKQALFANISHRYTSIENLT